MMTSIRNYGHQAPLENGLTLFHGNKRVSQVPLVAAEIGFKDRNGTRVSFTAQDEM